MRKDDEAPSDKLHGYAAILSAIHPVVWFLVTGLILVFVIAAVGLNIAAIPMFVNYVLIICGCTFMGCTGLVVGKILSAYYDRAYGIYHGMIKLRQEKARLFKLDLTNNLIEAKIREREIVPNLLQTALQTGLNIEYEGMKITNYLSNLHTLSEGRQNNLMIEAPNVLLPPKTEMVEVARRQDFSIDNIFLGIGPGNEDITIPLAAYVHGANDGSTGKGKTANGKGQIIQFLKAGIDCYVLNPHFALMTKNGDDWRPIAASLASQPTIDNGLPRVITNFVNIERLLEWTATKEIDRRFSMMRQGDYGFSPLYLFIDELPAIVSNCKSATDHLRTILQRGRAVECCVVINSQGFLNEDTEFKGSSRTNFDTAFFLGGSTYSGSKLLGMQEALLKEQVTKLMEPLGKGVAFLRNNTLMNEATIVRLPLVTNEFMYYVLGHHDEYILPVEMTFTQNEVTEADIIIEARDLLIERGDLPSLRNIAKATGFGKDKVGKLLKTI